MLKTIKEVSGATMPFISVAVIRGISSPLVAELISRMAEPFATAPVVSIHTACPFDNCEVPVITSKIKRDL